MRHFDGKKLRALRIAHGWTRQRLANALKKGGMIHCGRMNISNWECGKSAPIFEYVIALGTALKVSPKYFACDEEK